MTSDPFAGLDTPSRRRLEPITTITMPADAGRVVPPGSFVPSSGVRANPLNRLLAWGLLAIIAIAPIPLGSNRPALWVLWGVVVGVVGIVYGIGTGLLRLPLRAALSRFPLEASLTVLLMVWLAVQMLPLGQWLAGTPLAALIPAVRLLDGSSLMSPTLSLDPGSTLFCLINFATYGLFFFLFAQVVVQRRRARRMLTMFFVVICGFALYALFSLTQLDDTLLGGEKQYYIGYATGTFVNRNSLATFLAAGVAIGAVLLLDGLAEAPGKVLVRRWLTGLLYGLGLAIMGATLLATGSRFGIVAAAGGIVVAVFGWFATRRSRRYSLLWVLVGLAIVAAVLGALFGTGLLERVIYTRDENGRGVLYQQVLALIAQRPWTGFGGGSFASVFPAFQQAPLPTEFVWDKAHSTYLSLWFEMGIVAGSFPLLVIASLIIRSIRNLAEPLNAVPVIASLAVTTVFAVHSLVDFSAEIEANALLFTAMLAMGAAATRQAGSRG